MSSRTKEKERRRQERIEAEQAATRSASRKRTLRIAGGVVGALAVIAIIVVVATAGGGGSDNPDTSSLAADAKAAGCTFKSYPSQGRQHTSSRNVKYKTNPPTSGPHNPVPAPDGIYAPGNEPAPENAVHALEHGRIEFEYKAGASAADVNKLRSLAESEFNGTAAYHTLMFRNNTNMPTQFAAVAWTKLLTCNQLSSQAMDVMRQFRQAYTDKGPEFIP
jgi:hypothetical protein